MERTHEPIDFIPAPDQQLKGHAERVKAWLLANVPFMNERAALDVAQYEGGRLSLNLFGYLPCPGYERGEVQCETTLTLGFDEDFSERFEDPNGDWWTRKRMVASASWYSGGLRSVPARIRLDCITKTVELAEAFDAAFGADYIWTPGPTKAERQQRALEWKRDATKLKIASAISEAIHSTCRGMRVTNERFITCPPDCLDGEYVIELERKEYKAMPNTAGGKSLWFMRTK